MPNTEKVSSAEVDMDSESKATSSSAAAADPFENTKQQQQDDETAGNNSSPKKEAADLNIKNDLKFRENLYRLVISQLFYDGYQNIAVGLSAAIQV
jgi:hypothetical protein